MVSRLVHTQEIVGSTPTSATFLIKGEKMIIQNLAQLWQCGINSRNISRINLDEGFYLMEYLRRTQPVHIVEIGTKHAGTTFLFWATCPNSTVYTIDNGSEKHPILVENQDFLKDVNFIKANSSEYDNSDLLVDFLFIDGDHSYEQAKADWEHWKERVVLGGSVVFHDAKESDRPGVQRLMQEIREDKEERAKWSEFVPLPSTLVQFRRIR